MNLSAEIKGKIQAIATKHGLEFAVLFGSQATGRIHARSDVDIAVISRQPVNIDRLAMEFSEALGRDDVEVVDLSRSSPTLMRQVVLEGKLLYEKSFGGFFAWKIYAIKVWMETAWLRDLGKKKLMEWAGQS
ncbi:MAG: nucleotidyltransferase domain-containing protein [Patescibacteria group bacterium]|nr:nucleotidyltransferase domain-containing protein [Patescibacteria group bacterium]